MQLPRYLDLIRHANLAMFITFFKSIQSDYTMGRELQDNPFHVATVRSPLTRNLAIRFPDVQDEIASAFNDFIPPTEGSCLSLGPCGLC
jgi:hypothetical protein